MSFWDAIVNLINHDGVEHAGYLAFLALLALFPFLVLLFALLGFIGGGDIGAQFIAATFSHLPQNMVEALEPRIVEITSGPPQGLLTIAILGAIWTASSAVEGYRTVLNRAFRVHTPPAYHWRRLLSIAQLLIFSFIVIISMVALVFFPVAWAHLESHVTLPQFLQNFSVEWSDYLYYITAALLFIMVCNMYYVLPNIKQSFLRVAPGAAVTVAGWLIAVKLLTYYLSSFEQVHLIYGSLGGVIAALLFFYIINVIFIYGAEFNYLLQKAHGDQMEEKEQ